MRNILELILKGDSRQLESTMTRSGKTVDTFGRKTIATFQRVGHTINTVSDRYLNRFTGALSGAALLYAGKGVIDLDARLARLAITSGKGAAMLVGLKKELFAISNQTYTPVGDLVDYINVIVAKTGDLEFAMKTVKEAGLVSSSTGTSMADLGAVAANLSEKLKIKPGELFKSLDILNMGAKAGAIEFRDFAAQMEVIAASTGRFNLEGIKGVRTLSAWVQITKKSNASADEAATAIKNSIAEMLTLEKIKKMQKLGYNPIDTVATKKAGVTVMKNIEDVIKGIVTATKGDEIKLGEVFGIRSITAFTDMAREFRETGKFDTFDKFAKQGGDGVETMKDFHFWTEQTAAQLTNIKTAFSGFLNKNLAGPIEALNSALTFLNKNPILAKGGLYAMLGLGGILVASKAMSGISGLFGMLGRGKGIPGIAGGLAGVGAPIPVYIVDGPGGILDNSMNKLPQSVGGLSSVIRTLATKLGGSVAAAGAGAVIGGVAAAGTAGFVYGSYLKDKEVGNVYTKQGFTYGDWAEEALAKSMLNKQQYADYSREKDKEMAERFAAKIKNENNININVMPDNKALVSTNDPNTKNNINVVKRGNHL